MNASVIAHMNDDFREAILTHPRSDGKAVVTRSIDALEREEYKRVLEAVKKDNNFSVGNDPRGEHDFGAVELPNLPKVFWKIDYFADTSLAFGAENPEKSYRVLTIMLASEY